VSEIRDLQQEKDTKHVTVTLLLPQSFWLPVVALVILNRQRLNPDINDN
jgi:hypothetical protein